MLAAAAHGYGASGPGDSTPWLPGLGEGSDQPWKRGWNPIYVATGLSAAQTPRGRWPHAGARQQSRLPEAGLRLLLALLPTTQLAFPQLFDQGLNASREGPLGDALPLWGSGLSRPNDASAWMQPRT